MPLYSDTFCTSPSIHLYYSTLSSPYQSITSIINKTLTISIYRSLFPNFLFKMTTRRSRFLHLRTVRFDKWKTVWRRPERSEGTRRKDWKSFRAKEGMGTMGSQYIRGTTDLKQLRKGIQDRISGYLSAFYTNLWCIYKRKQQVFNKVFHIFHNGVNGWIKVGKSGGK